MNVYVLISGTITVFENLARATFGLMEMTIQLLIKHFRFFALLTHNLLWLKFKIKQIIKHNKYD